MELEWKDAPDRPGEWFKLVPGQAKPWRTRVEGFNGQLWEYAKGQFWELRPGPKWALPPEAPL